MPLVTIFQVAYDASLLKVRAEMLKHARYDVVSVLGNDEARRALDQGAPYQLVVVGWSATDAVRADIVRWVKKRWPKLRVIALYHAHGRVIPEADLNSCSEDPAEWFAAVIRAAAG